MPRSMWKGSIAFGLVNIPIELYSAVRDHRPKFRLLHAKDEAPVRYERVCQTEGKPVGWEDLVKGYEYQKGQFVVLTKDDFKTAALEKTKTIDILDFVDPGGDRRAVLRDALLPAAGKGSGPRLCAAARGHPRVGQDRHRQDHSPRCAASRRGRGDRRRDRADDDAVCRRARGSGRLQVSRSGRHPPAELKMARQLDRQPERQVGPRKVHRRIPRQPDEGDRGQAQGPPAEAPGARDAAVGRRGRSDGAAARQPRGQGRSRRRAEGGEARRAPRQARKKAAPRKRSGHAA